MLKRFLLVFVLLPLGSAIAQTNNLTVDYIMRDPQWIGTSPTDVRWSVDGKNIYFNWNPEKTTFDSLYKISLTNRTPQKVNKIERLSIMPTNGSYNKNYSQYLFEKNGDIFLHTLANQKTIQITNTVNRESNAQFSFYENAILFTADQNLFSWEITTGKLTQLTDFKRGKKSIPTLLSEQEKWLRQDQLAYLQVVKERDAKQQANKNATKQEQVKRPKEIYLDDKNIDQIRLSPNGKYITFRLTKMPMQRVQMFQTMLLFQVIRKIFLQEQKLVQHKIQVSFLCMILSEIQSYK